MKIEKVSDAGRRRMSAGKIGKSDLQEKKMLQGELHENNINKR